ncbi:metallophosphatase family protein [Alphaproteobacteria bacterium]|nr:metallophosphatase family protein [Alphaproteobacteria bacterium]
MHKNSVTTTIGVISDTHGLLRPQAKLQLTNVDYIIHAGDIGSPDIIPSLAKIAPVTAIKGNIDQATWAVPYADEETLELAGQNIFILHNRNQLSIVPKAAGFNIIISGHSHKPNIETIDDVLYLNPGSAGPRRFTLPITLAILQIIGGSIYPQIHKLVP